MGQSSEKVKSKLREMGVEQLPIQYKMNDEQCFGSQNSMIRLKPYSVLLNPNQIESYLQNLQFRKAHAQFLIQTLYAQVKKYNADYCKFVVYVQCMAFNLEQILSLCFQEMIKIVYFSLKGFQLLFQKYGYFAVEPVLIGINDIGEVKVWLNPKYNQYMPKASYSYAKLSSAEKSMVDEIKKIFESKTDKNSIQDKFMLENSTFEGLIAEIEAKYGKENLVNRIQISLNSLQNQSKSLASTIDPATETKNLSGVPKIRFNYRAMQNQTILKRLSNAASQKDFRPNQATAANTPKITINGRSVSVSNEKRTMRGNSITNIKFNYKNQKEEIGSPIKQIVESDLYKRQDTVEKGQNDQPI